MLQILDAQVILTADIPTTHKTFLQQRWQNLASLSGYDPQNDGYTVYLTEAEAQEKLSALHLDVRLEDMCFEGGWLDEASGCYALVCVIGNSFGWEFVIPHSNTFNPERLPWLAQVLDAWDETTE